jgi:rhodanese-related sulfurtransferase
MKGISMALAVMSVFMLSGVCLGAPVLGVSEQVYDFGVVIEGAEVSHDFVLQNLGDEDLVILSVAPSCGCTTTFLSQTTLPPLREVRFGVRLSTAGYGGATIEKTIVMETNAPSQSRVVFSLRGTVVDPAAYLMSVQEASGRFALVIDLRQPDAYASGHLVGAVNLPFDAAVHWMGLLPRNVPVIFYDADGSQAERLAETMLPLGYTNLSVLTGGFQEWVRSYGDRLIVTLPLVLDLSSVAGG